MKDSTQLRVPKSVNDRLKPIAAVLACSVAELAARALDAICDMMESESERPPLLIAEYKLRRSYQPEPKKKEVARKRVSA